MDVNEGMVWMMDVSSRIASAVSVLCEQVAATDDLDAQDDDGALAGQRLEGVPATPSACGHSLGELCSGLEGGLADLEGLGGTHHSERSQRGRSDRKESQQESDELGRRKEEVVYWSREPRQAAGINVRTLLNGAYVTAGR